MLICNRFIFVHVPKTAGIWLRSCLLEAVPIDWNLRILPYHTSAAPLLAYDDRLVNRKIFAFVRNPWDWYVSWWFYFLQNYTEHTGNYALDYALWKAPERYMHKMFVNGLSFDKALPFLCQGPYSLSAYVQRLCHSEYGKRLCQFGRMEHLLEDLQKLLPNEYPVLSATLESRKDLKVNVCRHNVYQQYYTIYTKDIVRDMEKEIIEEFGYSFP